MANPALRAIAVVGGPIDGKTVHVLNDEGGTLPPSIQIQQQAEIVINYRGQAISTRKGDVWLHCYLYHIVNRQTMTSPPDPKEFRDHSVIYCYSSASFVRTADVREINHTSLTD